MSLAAGSRLGAYEVVALLGAGGMGQVYRARDARLDRDVAIKVLPAALASDLVARERLRREAIAAARIDHPFICRVFDIGETDGLLFLVMELVRGETLSARLEAGPVSGATMLSWALEMAEALETAHARRIVHRDLKPANVMVTEQGHIKVMDFGLAKDVSAADSDAGAAVTIAPLTHHFVRVGTPGYMAPEQIVGGIVDARTDIFALGVMLAEVATGVHPFRRSTLPATTTAVISETPVFGASIATAPAGFAPVVLRMLAKSPDARYQSMAELRGDLIALASSAPAASELGGTRWAAADRIGQIRRWPLVARDAERAQLRERLALAIAGQGHMVLIGGEPGVGKTRLTEALLEEARDRGCIALVGHAYEMEGAAPFLPFIEMLEYSSRVVPPAALRRALGDAAPEIARLMPELRQMFPDIPPALDISAEQQRRMLFNGYRDFVARSAALAPIVAVLEDVHWADDSTLQLLLHVAPTIASLPMLVVATYRDVELDVHRPFAKALETLVRQRFAARMALKRLSADGVRALLAAMSGGGDPPPSLSRVVYAETEGNPFFVEEVFKHLEEEGRLFDNTGTWRADMRVETLEVPESVRLVIGRRLERLSEQARRVLTTAAVIGRSFGLTLLEEIDVDTARSGTDAVLDAVEEAERAHLVAAQQSGRETRYLFTHELIRQTLAESLSMPRRQRLHARIAAAIERVHASAIDRHVTAIAHHLFQAGAASDPEKTTAYLVRAAEEARTTSAPEDALRCLDQALSVWEAPPDTVLADLHDRRGRILRMLGRPGEAVDALSRAIAAWDADRDVDRLVGTAAELVITHLWQVDTAAALTVASRTLERVRGAAPVRQFPIEMLNIVALAVAGETPVALERFRAAEEARAWAGIRPLELLMRVLECHVRWSACDLAHARDLSRRVIATYTASEELWLVADVGWIAPIVDFYLGAQVADDEMSRAEALAEQVGQGAPLGLLRMVRSFLMAERGDLAGAEHAVRQNAEFNRAVGNRWGFFATQFAALLATLQGRFDEARMDIAEAVRNEPTSYYRRHSAATAFWILAHSSPGEAAQHWRTLGITPPDTRAINPLGAWASVWPAVLGLAILGRRDEAAAFSTAAAAIVETGIVYIPGSAAVGAAETIAGIAAGCAREWDAAEANFHAAIARAERKPMPLESSNARIWLADMLRHRDRPGDRERARALCDEAAVRAAGIGAVLYERQAREIQARLP
jgi:tetratricopeptide (TPR) repeat protein